MRVTEGDNRSLDYSSIGFLGSVLVLGLRVRVGVWGSDFEVNPKP